MRHIHKLDVTRLQYSVAKCVVHSESCSGSSAVLDLVKGSAAADATFTVTNSRVYNK